MTYHELWAELHEFALKATEIQWKNKHKWFNKWLNSVPNINCSCGENFRILIKQYPPDFRSREQFYNWSVDRHNDVNATLGKPHFEAEKFEKLFDLPIYIAARDARI